MRIDIITGFPALFQGPMNESIIKRARQNGHLDLFLHDLRDYTHDKHRTIDDSPYGGGAGMILKPEPIFECVDSLLADRSYDEIVLTTPQGDTFNQKIANQFSLFQSIILICGHYKGIDQRVRDALVTKEISIGDYVLTGGELAAMVIVDTVIRLVPGVVGDGESLLSDSFMEDTLDSPYYTRPPVYRGMVVPEALLSGDHKEIAKWRKSEADKLTALRRPDLLKRRKNV